ncbi:MAG TPA: hypothetical protein VF498_02380 [Anaerolineales bacterium]
MSDHQPSFLPGGPLADRNPATRKAHQREVLWQITVPLIVGLLALLALCVLAAIGPAAVASRWADVSLIWLILPMFIVLLIIIAIFGGIAFGVIKLIGVLPIYSRKVQDLFVMIGAQVRRFSDMAVEPVLRVHGFKASLQRLRRR